MALDLIYCAGGNERFSRIAYYEGWQLGCRSDRPHAKHAKLSFIDIDYKRPNWDAHLRRVATERPKYATITDLSETSVCVQDVERAIAQADQLSSYCEIALIIPKLSGQLALIPAQYAIGYSIPTSYGGAQYPIWELTGRRVHLLGGSPHEQIKVASYINAIGKVISADGNYSQKIAIEKCKYWRHSGRAGGQWVKWPIKANDQYYDCFGQSCSNIKRAWGV